MANGIFSFVSEEHLYGILENLQEVTGLQVQLLDCEGRLLRAFGETVRYCTLAETHIFTKKECFSLRVKAGQRAQTLGEAYIFSCHANLNLIVFPLINGSDLLGSVILGPFLMDQPDSTIISTMAEEYRLTPGLSLELYDELATLHVITPQRVNQLKKLMDHLFLPLMPAERATLLHQQEKAYQQSRINETIQIFKEQGAGASSGYFYEKEAELIGKVRLGSVREARAILNELLGHVLFLDAQNLVAIRTRTIELITLLSRVAIDGGARTDSIFELTCKFMSLLGQEQNFDDICALLQDAVESFMSSMFIRQDKGNIHVRQALRFIHDNYAQKLTLERVAEYVGLSSSHLSVLFRQNVGQSFREYLCRLRVEESKHLLLSTEYSLTDIAIAMGFVDQSHYCKAFKQITGISPGKFRNHQ